ncbi:MAG: putative membrane protein YfcA [Candidatus Azotimanducaceae bacterium]
MDASLSIAGIAALLVAGLIGGFINTLAGGGSMLTLPALMMLGMPADVANATNRVGVLLQSLTGVKGFRDQGRLDSRAIGPVLIPTLAGALVGSLFASFMPVSMLKPTLLVVMVGMALVMLIRPGAVIPPPDTVPYKVFEKPTAVLALFGAGVYGGFIQAGVGFILIAALAGGLRYDLVRTNALKMVCTAAFSVVALAVFVARDQVLWMPGLILAAGMVVGASLSVKFAISVPQNTLKWLLFIMVMLTCAAALLF